MWTVNMSKYKKSRKNCNRYWNNNKVIKRVRRLDRYSLDMITDLPLCYCLSTWSKEQNRWSLLVLTLDSKSLLKSTSMSGTTTTFSPTWLFSSYNTSINSKCSPISILFSLIIPLITINSLSTVLMESEESNSNKLQTKSTWTFN